MWRRFSAYKLHLITPQRRTDNNLTEAPYSVEMRRAIEERHARRMYSYDATYMHSNRQNGKIDWQKKWGKSDKQQLPPLIVFWQAICCIWYVLYNENIRDYCQWIWIHYMLMALKNIRNHIIKAGKPNCDKLLTSTRSYCSSTCAI